MTKRLLLPALLTGVALAAAPACSFSPSDARIGIDAPPLSSYTDGSQNTPPTSVGDFLDHRCGSLDCHGNPQRNFQLWGCEGQRLPLEGGITVQLHPGCRNAGGMNTTAAEYEASYRSLVALEPALMSSVVKAGPMGNPDLLTFVRKARGEEDHKGGTLVTAGDTQDICMTAWLTGPSDVSACANAIATTP